MSLAAAVFTLAFVAAAGDPATPLDAPPAPLDPAAFDDAAPTPPPASPEAGTSPSNAPSSAPSTLDPADPSPTPTTPTPPACMDGAAFDARAEERLASCLEAIAAGKDLEARACLRAVVEEAPGTLPAAKAGSAIAVLDAQVLAGRDHNDVEATANATLIPAGRLGITTAAGLFGVWNGVAAGLITQVTAPGLNPGITLIGSGVLAVGLGATFAVGGYMLADKLELDEGAARLVASGLLWGTNIGIGSAFVAGDALALTNSTLALDAALLTVVLGGYAGAGAALGIASLVEFDEAQVSLINTGGWIGSLLGLLILPNYATYGAFFGPGTLALYGATYAALATAGLLGGGVAGRFLHLTWGEALLADLGGVAGVVLGGALSLGVVATTGGTLGQASVPFVTGAVALGALGGAAGAIGGAMVWRNARGAPLLRGEPDGLHATVGAVGAVVDKAGNVVPTAPILALAW